MNRASFIHSLVAGAGLAAIPKHWVKHYQKVYLLQCFVRGFRFTNGDEALLGEIKEGTILQLVREPENEHDCFAIALHFNKERIGYLPGESNEIMSSLLDSGIMELHSGITRLEPKARAWENVHVGVYLLKEKYGTIRQRQSVSQ